MKRLLLLALAVLMITSLATAQTKLIFGARNGDNAEPMTIGKNNDFTAALWIRTDPNINIVGVHIPLASKNVYVQSNSRDGGELLFPFPLWEDVVWLNSNADTEHPGYTNQSILGVKDIIRDPNPNSGINTNGEWWQVASYNMTAATTGDNQPHTDAFIIGDQVDNGGLVLVDYTTGEMDNDDVLISFSPLTVEDPLGVDEKVDQPTEFSLSQNYPNPFNASTTINYSLLEGSDVTIDIFDIMGRKIETLVSGYQDAGSHSVVWNANSVSSGVYLYKIVAGNYTETRRCNLLK